MSMKKVHDRIDSDIAKFGRSLMGVFGDDKKGLPPFTYTIGNHDKGLPELLVIGLCQAGFLNALSEMMIKRGRKFDNDETVSLGGKCPVYLIDAADAVKDAFTFQATQHYAHAGYDVMQVVLSDPAGLFPWHDGCAKPYAEIAIYRALNG